MKRRRATVAIVLAVAAVLFSAAAVAAAGPVRQPVEYPLEGFFLPAGSACEFDLQADFLVNREKMTTFMDSDGNPIRSLVTGSLVVRLTNLENDASTVINISGPLRLVYNDDGTSAQYFHGRSIAFFEGIFYLAIGRHVFLVDQTGFSVIEEGSKSGRSIDVCGSLAAD